MANGLFGLKTGWGLQYQKPYSMFENTLQTPSLTSPTLPKLNFGTDTQQTVTPNKSSDNIYDFFEELKASDKNVLENQEKLVKQKSIMDIAGSTLAAWENFTAPLPDRMAAPRFTGTEATLPVNLLTGQFNRQQGGLISQGRGLFRATGNASIIPAISGNLVEQGGNFNASLASTMSDFVTQQQQQANQINNLNAEARSKTDEYNAKLIAADNLQRSQIGSQMVGQIGQAIVDRNAGLINIGNMRGQNLAIQKFAKNLIDSGNWEMFYKMLPSLGGFSTSDVSINDETAAAKTY